MANAGAGQKVRAAQADIEATPLYRTGSLDTLQQLRDRGALGPSTPPAFSASSAAVPLKVDQCLPISAGV
jgi:hypothetical protein